MIKNFTSDIGFEQASQKVNKYLANNPQLKPLQISTDITKYSSTLFDFHITVLFEISE